MYLLVEIAWPAQSAGAVANVGLATAHWDAVIPGLFKPQCVPPVRVVVNTTAVKLGADYQKKRKKRNLALFFFTFF